MKNKTLIILTILFFSGIFLLNLVSAENCFVTDRASCSGSNNVVFGLSSIGNAHGEFPDALNYADVLCCDFSTQGGSTTCSGTNKIIGLSSATNAHGEIPENNNYGTDVCYENLKCRSTTAGCYSNETGILSLSSATNAHIGNSTSYATEICCNPCSANQNYVGGVCITKSIPYWADTNNNFITDISVVPGTTQIKLIIDKSNEVQGTSMTFEIFERDTVKTDGVIIGATFDDNIRTKSQGNELTGIVDSSGNASVNWTITQADIDNSKDGILNEKSPYEFYFQATATNTIETSGDLNATLSTIDNCVGRTLCSEYLIKGDCLSDVCGVAVSNVELNNPGACANPLNTCSCDWNISITPKCNPKLIIGNKKKIIPGASFPEIGICNYEENSQGDDCSDGFLSYSWNALWTWDVSNSNTTAVANNPDWIEDPSGSGNWYYDPNKESIGCVGGEKVVPCPAQIELPFFSTLNAIAIIIILILIYVYIKLVLNKKKKQKIIKKRKRHNKVKKVKKNKK